MTTLSSPELTFAPAPRQAVSVAFDAPDIVSDTGLLTLRDLDRRLGYLADLARRLPDPRAQDFVTHSAEQILTQQVYQILADYPDCNDANALRHDPLFQTLADRHPADDQPLASGSTLARFQYAFTRRQLELPEEDRPAFRDMYQARSHRLGIINDFLVDTFIRTRRQPPAYVILDCDPTADPTHGAQILSAYHGYYRQHQYFPLLVFEGVSGFPLAAWLRPGTAHGSWGAVEVLRALVAALRRAWPGVLILVRGDHSLAVPAMYTFCETEGLLYAFGYASNPALQRRTERAFWELQEYYHFYGWRVEPQVQRFEVLEDYQAAGWERPRRVLCKLECTPSGSQRRFVVTNLSGDPRGLYHGFYVERGEVPEQPFDALKNGLDLGRLSAHSFRANAYRLLLHVVAYGLVVLLREAAAAIAEVSRASVGTLRQRLWKVGAWVEVKRRVVCFHVSATWPGRSLWARVQEAVVAFAGRLMSVGGDSRRTEVAM
jgi:hypothetical protein